MTDPTLVFVDEARSGHLGPEDAVGERRAAP